MCCCDEVDMLLEDDESLFAVVDVDDVDALLDGSLLLLAVE
jgi:hypothetical protein